MVAEEIRKKNILHKENISGASRWEDDFHILQMNGEKTMIWIHHYHPNNYGTFWKNRNKYALYAQKAAKSIKGYYGDKRRWK